MASIHRRDAITGMLATVAVLTVLIVAGGYAPAGFLPAASDELIALIPHVNVVISLVAIATITFGWTAIRLGSIAMHRRAMLAATGLFALFLILYLYRLAILGGPTGYDGSVTIYRFVYLPVLTLHIGLAIICIPLLFDAIALGLTVPIRRLPRTRHPRVGRIAAALWILSFSLGIVVYLLLYWI